MPHLIDVSFQVTDDFSGNEPVARAARIDKRYNHEASPTNFPIYILNFPDKNLGFSALKVSMKFSITELIAIRMPLFKVGSFVLFMRLSSCTYDLAMVAAISS